MRNLPLSLSAAMLTCTALLGCGPADLPTEDASLAPDFPAATAGPTWRGPGGPASSFGPDELYEHCGYLPSGPSSFEHHNLVMPYRGHLVFPWASEWGFGGLSLFDMSDPCTPQLVGMTEETFMRESHAIGFVHLAERPADLPQPPVTGDYAVVTYMGELAESRAGGVMFWDLTDPANPVVVSALPLEGVIYPDSYARVVLSVFWAYPYVYVAGADNGVYVVDATDPTNPLFVTQLADLDMRVGGVFALGDRLLITSAQQTGAALYDISDPSNPVPFAGGRFTLTTGDGTPVEAYHANLAGDYALFARKEGGGGPIVFDISEPTAPAFLSELPIDGMSGGYVFYDEGLVFTGDSNGAHITDMRDMSAPSLVTRLDLVGDLDTMTPYGNVAILSVDDEAEDGKASAIVPFATAPDTTPPEVLAVRPVDGATGVSPSIVLGFGFNEPIEPSSVFPGSVRLVDEAGTPVWGTGSGQENTGHYAPLEPLKPGTTYTLELAPNGVMDLNGNALQTGWTPPSPRPFDAPPRGSSRLDRLVGLRAAPRHLSLPRRGPHLRGRRRRRGRAGGRDLHLRRHRLVAGRSGVGLRRRQHGHRCLVEPHLHHPRQLPRHLADHRQHGIGAHR